MKKFKPKDKVIVLTGKSKNKVAEIAKVLPKDESVILEGCHFYTKHLKPSQGNQGGIKELPLPIKWSNIAHYDEKKSKKCKVRFKVTKDTKQRVIEK